MCRVNSPPSRSTNRMRSDRKHLFQTHCVQFMQFMEIIKLWRLTSFFCSSENSPLTRVAHNARTGSSCAGYIEVCKPDTNIQNSYDRTTKFGSIHIHCISDEEKMWVETNPRNSTANTKNTMVFDARDTFVRACLLAQCSPGENSFRCRKKRD